MPRTKNHLVLKKPSGIYLSRMGTVGELHLKIASILYENKQEISISQLIQMSRMWRLETGETVLDIEKYFEEEVKSLPIRVRGRVL